MVQYYHDIWYRHSHILTPLTALVGECGKVKSAKKKNKKFHWDAVHQQAFNEIKKVVSKEVTLNYPNFTLPFDIYLDASDYQLGAVIMQKGKPLAFYSRKLNKAQLNYTVTEK